MIPHPLRCRIAAVLCCFNRRRQTLEAVECLLAQVLPENVGIDMFVTDDGSSDGTAAAIRSRHPAATILEGDGTLFWNGGMRRALERAFAGDYDFYLWLNDDTCLYPDTVRRMLDTHPPARHGTGTGTAAIVVGSTRDDGGVTTYGGEVRTRRLRPLALRLVVPAAAAQRCDTFNGNCVLVSRRAAAVLGNLDAGFAHAMGDTDYGLRALRAGVPMLVMPGFAGRCVNDHAIAGSYLDPDLPLARRWRKIMAPKGLPWRAWLTLCRRHAGVFWPLHWAWPYIKLLAGARRARAASARPPRESTGMPDT